jgi:carbonic anhydrase
VDKVASHNVERTIEEIRKQSAIMADLESQGKIKIVGAMYDISSGKVTFM